MSAWAAQRPVAEDIARFQPRLRIDGVQIIPAGGLAEQRFQDIFFLQVVFLDDLLIMLIKF
jgi:hypothetical protein